MSQIKDPSRFLEPARTTRNEVEYRSNLDTYFDESVGSNVEKLQNFTKYVPTQDIRKFICRHEMFKKVLNVHGSIVECGVLYGGGLMSWAQLSEVYEPLNHLRHIIGFDTFEGFTELTDRDVSPLAQQGKKGGLAIDTHEDLKQAIDLYDSNRFLNHIDKVRLVRGDACETIPTYVKENPYIVVALLWLDFDVYKPTMAALEVLLPRIPKGGIIAFDELNHEVWPGETIAVMEALGISNLRLERFAFGSTVSYAIME